VTSPKYTSTSWGPYTAHERTEHVAVSGSVCLGLVDLSVSKYCSAVLVSTTQRRFHESLLAVRTARLTSQPAWSDSAAMMSNQRCWQDAGSARWRAVAL
jgi:hypothetical protein